VSLDSVRSDQHLKATKHRHENTDKSKELSFSSVVKFNKLEGTAVL